MGEYKTHRTEQRTVQLKAPFKEHYGTADLPKRSEVYSKGKKKKKANSCRDLGDDK